MPRGGARPGSGRKSVPKRHEITLQRVRPERYRELEALGGLTPEEVMRSNMTFYFEEAGEVMATIMELPTASRDEQQDARFAAMEKLADHFRMRDRAQDCARDLARYCMRPMGPKPYSSEEEKGQPGDNAKVINVIPTHPSVHAAFERAAQGLPPEKRKIL